jgi:hypothetical protein
VPAPYEGRAGMSRRTRLPGAGESFVSFIRLLDRKTILARNASATHGSVAYLDEPTRAPPLELPLHSLDQ